MISTNAENTFENWLLENYGFEADMTPIKNLPPTFLDSTGSTFDATKYEAWKDVKRIEWQISISDFSITSTSM